MALTDMKAAERRALVYLQSLNIDMTKLGYTSRGLRDAEFSTRSDDYKKTLGKALDQFAKNYGGE